MRIWMLVMAVVWAGACSEAGAPEAPLVVDEGCQPLLATTSADLVSRSTCLLPYPSDFHREPDPTMPTGFRIALRGAAKPRKRDGTASDPHDGWIADGASTIPAIVATLPSPLSREGLPGITADHASTMRAESPTVLIDAETGAFIAHYTDLHEDDDDGRHAAVVLRPLAPLRHRARYVAALAGVKTTDGSPAPPAEGFRRLREHRDERLERDVIGPLGRAGVARDRLQLAWDCTTGSAERTTSDLVRVIELTRAWLAANIPEVQVTSAAPDIGSARCWSGSTGGEWPARTSSGSRTRSPRLPSASPISPSAFTRRWRAGS